MPHRRTPEGRWVCVPKSDAVLGNLERFAVSLARRADVGEVLLDLTEQITQALALIGASVTLVVDGRQQCACSALRAIGELERAQEQEQAGPGIDAVATREQVTVADLSGPHARRRWPAYTAVADSFVIRAVAA